MEMNNNQKTSYTIVKRGNKLAPSEFNRMVNEDKGLGLHHFCLQINSNTWQSGNCPSFITPNQQEEYIRKDVIRWLKLNNYPTDSSTFETKIIYCDY